MADLPRPAVRRPISISVLCVALVLVAVLTPVVLPVLAIVDVLTRSRLRRARVWLLHLAILGNEALGTWLAVGATIVHVGRLDGAVAQDRFHRLMMWWAANHLDNLRRFAGLRWVVENPEETEAGNAIVLARHASHADAVLPVLLFGHGGGHRLRYTLKDDLQWSPAMDIVGNRLPHVFIDRTPGPGSPLADRIRALARGVDDHTVAVIFPEGTFHTPERLDRAARRIAETRPDLEDAVRTLEYLLPPRPGGTHALMEGAPAADLVLVAHEGMEAFGDLAAIRANTPLEHPVRVRLWRIPRHEVPTDDDEFAGWLLERWIDMDRWIQKRVIERRSSAGDPPSLISGREFRP
jgi:1-acyl-sn-glycerol-3-phosphate acyltransferase